MSGRLLRLVCTAAMAAGIALAPVPATAEPEPGGAGGDRSVAGLLTDLQRLYQEAEKATETYNATEERLKKQRAEVKRLDAALARTRLSLHDSRGAAGRLARQQYQNSSNLSPYLRLLLARDPQHALDQGHVIGQLARERVETVGRLAGDEKRAGELARRAREALDEQLALAERQEVERDDVEERLRAVEELLASLTPEELAALAEFERNGITEDQERFMASGALGDDGRPSAEGDRAVRFAVEQLGKPYEWGAEGPASYDCSGLTSVAWERAGSPIPRTSQEQWARLERVPLGELRPGDLVVYFPEATHVALYLGDGMVVQAPRPGAEVKVSPIAANPVLGAVRPDPDGEPLRRYAPPRLPEETTDGSDEGYADAYAPAAPETSIR
ncbi:C40 family peptidase [Streptomyces sp. DH41]|uniref:C40 family peptidase n=1 Tax=Streptomyces sp. DH41 TaxID=3040125 RepID=UPI0024417FE0|nr:C40 family peptidase [Streptomyces sp. DH41]MDG9721825.1 NlpC/P60 family protein [Streptomyces sp. DH41]